MFADDFARILEKMHVRDDLVQNIIVSSEENYKISNIVDIIVDKFKFTGQVVYTKEKGAGVFKKPTCNKIFRSYFPDFKFTSIQDGLSENIDYFINNINKVRK